MPPPAKTARGRGRARVAADPPSTARAVERGMTREAACARPASSGATTGAHSSGAATRAVSSGAAAALRVPASDEAAGPQLEATPSHVHGEAANKRREKFMRRARLNAPTAAAMMGSPAEDDDIDERVPAKRMRTAAAAPELRSPRPVTPERTQSPPAAPPPLLQAAAENPVQDVAEEHVDLPMDAQNLSRCPLYFLACVAAKEKFTGV